MSIKLDIRMPDNTAETITFCDATLQRILQGELMTVELSLPHMCNVRSAYDLHIIDVSGTIITVMWQDHEFKFDGSETGTVKVDLR